MHYLLDLETLLIFLSRQYQSGELSADLKRFPGLASKKGYRVRILLMQGKMASCTVRNEEGKLLIEGEAALKALLKIVCHALPSAFPTARLYQWTCPG